MFCAFYIPQGCPSEDVKLTGLVPNNVSIELKLYCRELNGDSVADNRQTEFTDRAVNPLAPTQVVELGTIQDVGPTTATDTDGVIVQVPYSDIIEKFTFDDVLERTYNVGTFNWTTAQAAGTVITTLSFPQILFAQQFIADKIKYFYGFRGGIEVGFRIAASRTLYGALIANVDPCAAYYPINNAVQSVVPSSATSPWRMSGSPHILIQASCADVVTITCPFINPQRFLNLRKYANKEICSINLMVLNPLTNTENATSSGQIFVTARFVDASLLQPCDTTQSTPSEKVRERVKNIEGIKKNIVVSKVNEIQNPAPSFIKRIQLAGNTIAACAMDAVETAAVGMMLGLSKPNTTNFATVMRSDPNMTTNYGNSVEVMPKGALDSENAISTEPNVGGISADELALSYFCGTPVMVNSITFVKGSTPISLVTTGIDANPAYCDYAKLMHYAWSGTHKVKIYITASIFHSCRYVLYYATSAASDWQQCYHTIVEVQGSTEVDLELPYFPQSFVGTGVTTERVWDLYCAELTFSQPDNSIALPVYFNVYKAGSTDFKVFGPKDVQYLVQSAPREDFTKPFTKLHGSMEGYGHKGFVYGEEMVTWREYMHRLWPLYAVTTVASRILQYGDNSGQVCMGTEFIMLFYRYWRGSVRFKLLNLKAATGYNSLFQSVPTMGLVPGAGLSNPNMNSCELEMPYYSPALFDMVHSNQVYPREYATSGTNSKFLFKGAGDDFSLHWLMLPPPGTVVLNTPGSSIYGYAGLQSYYAG